VTANVYGLRLLRKPRVRLVVLVGVLVVVLVYRLGQFIFWTGHIQWAYDFSFYWVAAGHLLHGEPIYSAMQLAGPYAPQGQVGFLYPPPFAVAVIPFALVFGDPRLAEWGGTAIDAVIVVAVDTRRVWPARQPSPKNCPGWKIPTTASLPRSDTTTHLILPF